MNKAILKRTSREANNSQQVIRKRQFWKKLTRNIINKDKIL